MTIPEDVRAAMRQALEFCAGDYRMTGDRYDHFEAALAWLEAQPAAPQTMPEEERVTIPKDVRTAAYTLMQRHLTEPFANDEERWLVLRQADDACELLDAWLEAQPAAPAPERWEPVEDAEITLPDDLRICRRVEVTP